MALVFFADDDRRREGSSSILFQLEEYRPQQRVSASERHFRKRPKKGAAVLICPAKPIVEFRVLVN